MHFSSDLSEPAEPEIINAGRACPAISAGLNASPKTCQGRDYAREQRPSTAYAVDIIFCIILAILPSCKSWFVFLFSEKANMDNQMLSDLLKSLYDHGISIDDAAKRLADMPFHDMGFAKVDHHRALRVGHSEVIFCLSKTVDQILAIVAQQIAHGETVFGTRASTEAIDAVAARWSDIEASRLGKCFWRRSESWKADENAKGTVVIVSGGTSDSSVVEEARCTLEIMGHPCAALQDVGVAGIHRLLAHRDELAKASVLIVVAGMEGALPSVVAGLVRCPVVGVPTSVGYGAHLGGMVPMFAMLNSCASGLTVVNIDNGFGAACAAVRMNRK
jgi:pyridinium-3,5-biscarboxylic acid mononucleotide synthase